MSTCPALSEFKVLSSRIREIEIALDQVFDELNEAAIAPTASTLKDLLARRRDCRPTHRYQHTAYNPLKTADLQRPRRNHQESCRDQKNQRPIITVPIDATSGETELTVTSPRSKRKGMCLQVTQDTGRFSSPSFTPTVVMKYTEHNAIPNINALSPTTKRKHDVNVAEACLSGKEGGGEASFETGTPAK
ncbi:hypothetical protein CPB85DRAFT_1256004 [Mucidula mucida]|nr:hypothetical protein CPB85DRAFT_1256004 [Mucidula mucida]